MEKYRTCKQRSETRSGLFSEVVRNRGSIVHILGIIQLILVVILYLLLVVSVSLSQTSGSTYPLPHPLSIRVTLNLIGPLRTLLSIISIRGITF